MKKTLKLSDVKLSLRSQLESALLLSLTLGAIVAMVILFAQGEQRIQERNAAFDYRMELHAVSNR